MAQDTLTPWAETAPGKGRMSRITIDEMMARRYLAAGVRLLWMV